MRANKLWAFLLGVETAAIVESVVTDEDDDGLFVVACVRKHHEDTGRCPHCLRRCVGYDQGDGPRRWRTLDLGSVRAFIEADAPRVRCPQHGVVVEHMPWARGTARFTRAFEDQVAWLAARTDKTALSMQARVAWRTVGAIIERVVVTERKKRDPLDGVSRIGIDEVSYRYVAARMQIERLQNNRSWYVIANNVETLSIRYWDDSETEIFPADESARRSIRKVGIALRVRTTEKDRVTGKYKTYTTRTEIAPRNLPFLPS